MALATMGFELFGAILVCGGIGWLLDRWLGTRPSGTVAGLVLGVIAGMVRFVRTALKANR